MPAPAFAWRGGRNQLPPSFPRSPGIIPVAHSLEYFNPLALSTVLSRNEVQLGRVSRKRKVFLYSSYSPIQAVNNLRAKSFTCC